MTPTRTIAVSCLLIGLIGGGALGLAPTAQAAQTGPTPMAPQTPEIGVRVPLAGVVAYPLTPNVQLEASAVVPGFTAPLVSVEGRLVGKLYVEPLTLSGLSITPFVGAGGVGLYAERAGEVRPGAVGLVGLEHRPETLPVRLALEGHLTWLPHPQTPALAVGVSVGARLALAP